MRQSTSGILYTLIFNSPYFYFFHAKSSPFPHKCYRIFIVSVLYAFFCAKDEYKENDFDCNSAALRHCQLSLLTVPLKYKYKNLGMVCDVRVESYSLLKPKKSALFLGTA